MNFIELVRRVKLESGRLTAGPASVASATGRDAMVASWVNDAWRQIQQMPKGWRWKRKTAVGAIVTGDADYTAAGLGIADFGEWCPGDRDYYRPRVYPAATPTDYTLLQWLDYPRFQATFLRPGQQAGVPQYWSESPDGKLLLGPTPDRDLSISIDYFDAEQVLASDLDEPAMPSAHHMVIVWKALQEVAMFDAAPDVMQRAAKNYAAEFDDLLERQGEPMRIMGRA